MNGITKQEPRIIKPKPDPKRDFINYYSYLLATWAMELLEWWKYRLKDPKKHE